MRTNQAGYKEATFSALSKLPEDDEFKTPAKLFKEESLLPDSLHRPTTATAGQRVSFDTFNNLDNLSFPKPFGLRPMPQW